MKQAKILKFIIAILIVITIFIAFTQNSFAISKPIDSTFVGHGDKSNTTNVAGDIIGTVINATQIIGMGVAIIMLIVLGIKYMYASPGGKAQIAKSAKYYILGAIFIFAAVGLLQIVKNFSEANFGNVQGNTP